MYCSLLDTGSHPPSLQLQIVLGPSQSPSGVLTTTIQHISKPVLKVTKIEIKTDIEYEHKIKIECE